MRIKPYVVLGLVTLFAGVGLVVIVTGSDPATASPTMIWLFWGALFLTFLGLMGTLFSFGGQRLALALINGACWAAGLVSLAALGHEGVLSRQLSVAIIGATILLSFILWIRLRKSDEQL